MRIGIDIRYLSHALVGGVRNYVRYLVPELVALGAQHQFVLYADTKAPLELDIAALPPNARVRLLPYRNALSSVVNDLTIGRVMARDGVEVAHFPANYGWGPPRGVTTFTLHDAINIRPLRDLLCGSGSRRTLRYVLMMTYLNRCSTATLSRAKIMFTDSAYARDDILNYCAFDRANIVITHISVAPHFRRIDDARALEAVRARLKLPARFVLADALKNPAVIARAWARLPQRLRDSHRIVFFTRQPNLLPAVGELVRAGTAVLLLRPADEDLVALYNMADAFVFPSWIEGFGIPLLEAMRCGAPVIASDRGSIPEVAGDAALLIDAEDDAALARHLTAVLSDAACAAALREKGFARAAGFSWRNTAARTLSGYALAGKDRCA